MAGKLWLLTFSLGLSAVLAKPASACSSPAAYRSVVVNQAPEHVPGGAVALKVRVDKALHSAAKQQIQGLRATTLEAVRGIPVGSTIEIKLRLTSMCDTWVEMWSDDHNSENGVLTGFITGNARRQPNRTFSFTPVLFQRAEDRDWSKGPESLSRGLVARGTQRPLDPIAKWVPFKIDAEALARNLDETNAAIRRNLDEMETRRQTPPSGLPPQH
ncbi:hypothetical protein [Blastomonas fulva]|uniref:hypothetical protein n=1 Tax=Blastomonas fulva TaxID=1550728 RepID=UPI0025A3F3A5|nr:hypothetical protein [Blastomonas fulva]MDM7928970.1 hypothetical protein [Blastomonas fulva]MDM7965839.1 hypothetical protein [Blastomonas fulva]